MTAVAWTGIVLAVASLCCVSAAFLHELRGAA